MEFNPRILWLPNQLRERLENGEHRQIRLVGVKRNNASSLHLRGRLMLGSIRKAPVPQPFGPYADHVPFLRINLMLFALGDIRKSGEEASCERYLQELSSVRQRKPPGSSQ